MLEKDAVREEHIYIYDVPAAAEEGGTVDCRTRSNGRETRPAFGGSLLRVGVE